MTGRPASAAEEYAEHAADEPAEHPVDVDTRVDRLADGRFAATLSDRWNVLGGAINGGYYVAVCVRALRQALPHPDPSSCPRSSCGAAHRDRSKCVRRWLARVAGCPPDRRGCTRTAGNSSGPPPPSSTWTSHKATTVLATQPDLPVPEAAADPVGAAGVPGVTMTDHVEYRFPGSPG